MWRRRADLIDRANAAAAGVELPSAVYKTCPWQPRALIETGLRQWLRCCAPALRDGQVIGMPSRAVDEAWHGFILCTARYSAFCKDAYGRYLHHHPEGGAPDDIAGVNDPLDEQLGRTVVAWALVAGPTSIVCSGTLTKRSAWITRGESTVKGLPLSKRPSRHSAVSARIEPHRVPGTMTLSPNTRPTRRPR